MMYGQVGTSMLICLLVSQISHVTAITSTVSTITGSTSTGSTITGSTSTGSTITGSTITGSTGGSNTTNSTVVTSIPTTLPTTTAIPLIDRPHNTDIALYVFQLTVGQDNESQIMYKTTNLTSKGLLSQLSGYFANFSFAVDLDLNNTNSQGTVAYILKIKFQPPKSNDSHLLDELTNALSNLDKSDEFNVTNMNATSEAVSEFIQSTTDICAAINICPLGFTCFTAGCQHMCRVRDCSNHGVCYTNVAANTAVSTLCICDSEYETEYTGDNCQYSRRGRLQIIAIIAGVLGAACLVFIIIIIIMCILYSRHKSSSNYNLSGASYTNSAFDNNTRQK